MVLLCLSPSRIVTSRSSMTVRFRSKSTNLFAVVTSLSFSRFLLFLQVCFLSRLIPLFFFFHLNLFFSSQGGASGGVNSNLMELLLLLHTLRFSSAKRITAIVPYFAYARQDRKTKPRVHISASVVAQLIEAMHPDRLVTVDLHCGQIQGFFHHTPVDNLYAENQILEYLKGKGFLTNPESLCIVSPDAGGVGRATRVANKTGAKHIVTILKRRVAAGQVDSMQLVGDVSGLICVIVDDMIDTAGTLCKAAQLLKDNGAAQVYAFTTHGLLSGPACDRINSSCLEEVCVTDSIPQEARIAVCPKLTVISLADLLADAIYRLHNEESLSELFTEPPAVGSSVSSSSFNAREAVFLRDPDAIPSLNLN